MLNFSFSPSNTVISTIVKGGQDALTLYNQSLWGIYNENGKAVLTSGSVTAHSPQLSNSITKSPQQAGSFTSINKVHNPTVVNIEIICDGTQRGSMLDNFIPQWLSSVGDEDSVKRVFTREVVNMQNDLNTYTVLCPEYAWQRMNCTGGHMDKTAEHGAYMTVFSLTFEEVRSAEWRNELHGLVPSADPLAHFGNFNNFKLPSIPDSLGDAVSDITGSDSATDRLDSVTSSVLNEL